MAFGTKWMWLILVLAAGPVAAQEQIVWQTDIAKAVKQAKAEKKLVLVHFYGDTCAPCKDVERNVFPQPLVVQAMMRNYVPVKINIDKEEKIAAAYGIRQIPQDVFLAGGTGQVLNRTITKETAAEYSNFLDNYAIQTGSGASREAAFRERASRYEQQNVQAEQAPAVQQKLVQNQFVVPNRYSKPAQTQPQVTYGEGAGASNSQPQVGPYGEQPEPTAKDGSVPGYAPQGGAGGARTDLSQDMQRTNFQDQADITTRPPVRNHFIAIKDIPPIGMDGYCPVSVTPPGPKLKGAWKKGDPRYGAVHRGRTYLFVSAVEQAKFLANPDAYCPVLSGADPVIFAETGKLVDGKREFGMALTHEGRDEMYFFTSEENLLRFNQNPGQFGTIAHQAMLKGETQTKYR